MTTIEGDISLLCYFPLNSLNYNMDMVSKDEGKCVAHKKLKGGKEKAIPTKYIESSVLLKQKEKANFSEKDISDVVDSDATSGFLLARALEEIDNERENIYERPRGKNYRIAEREIDTMNVMKNQTRKTFS